MEDNLCEKCGCIIPDDEVLCDSCKYDLYCSKNYSQEPTREMLMDAEII